MGQIRERPAVPGGIGASLAAPWTANHDRRVSVATPPPALEDVSDIRHLAMPTTLRRGLSPLTLVPFPPMRLLSSFAAGLTLLAWAGLAAATPGITGSSGRNGGDTCKSCHGSNSPSPEFEIGLPENVQAGATVEVTVKMTGSLKDGDCGTGHGGGCKLAFNAAFDADAVVTPGTLTMQGSSPNEVVTIRIDDVPATTAADLTTTSTFSVKIPMRVGSLNFYVAGINTNGNAQNSGDRFGTGFASATINGAGGGTSSGDTGSSGGVLGPGTGTGDPDAGAPVIIKNPILPDGDPGCQTSPGSTPDITALVVAGAVVISLGRRRRR